MLVHHEEEVDHLAADAHAPSVFCCGQTEGAQWSETERRGEPPGRRGAVLSRAQGGGGLNLRLARAGSAAAVRRVDEPLKAAGVCLAQ